MSSGDFQEAGDNRAAEVADVKMYGTLLKTFEKLSDKI
jgi:hypothetical protein